MKKKMVTLCLVVALVLTAAIGGTMAYFTDYTEETVNKFKKANVDITMTEAAVDVYGDKIKDAARLPEGTGNEYKLVPGHTYTKDPMVTVNADSEEMYVRMFVTITDAEDVKTYIDENFLPQNFVAGWQADKWLTTNVVKEENNTLVYEFRYFEPVSTVGKEAKDLEPLFTSFTLPTDLTQAGINALADMQIIVKAQAIQADTFKGDVNEAWTAYDEQDTHDQQK